MENKKNKSIKEKEKVNIVSAGGFLIDLENKKLLVLKALHHNGKMELPKGKVETGETPERAAQHEIAEESGYFDIRPLEFVGESHFRYVNKVKNYSIPYGAHVEKTVHYFLFTLNSHQKDLSRRESHEEFENYWIPLSEAYDTLSFPGDKELFLDAEKLLEKYLK